MGGGRGKLEAAHLRSLLEEEALRRLEDLPCIGPFSVDLILLRGAGAPDLLPAKEPRLGRVVAMAYGLDAPPPRKSCDCWPWAGAPTGRG